MKLVTLLLIATSSCDLALGVTNKQYEKIVGYKLDGSVGLERKVKSRTECGVLCASLSCGGFDIKWDLKCYIYTSISSVTADGEAFFYRYMPDYLTALGFVALNSRYVMPYKLGLPPLSFSGAQSYCQQFGGKIFRPRTADDWNWLTTQHYEKSYGHTWIPIQDVDTEGVLRWVDDGSSAMNDDAVTWVKRIVAYSNSPNEDCVTAHYSSGKLEAHMDVCTRVYKGFACELE